MAAARVKPVTKAGRPRYAGAPPGRLVAAQDRAVAAGNPGGSAAGRGCASSGTTTSPTRGRAVRSTVAPPPRSRLRNHLALKLSRPVPLPAALRENISAAKVHIPSQSHARDRGRARLPPLLRYRDRRLPPEAHRLAGSYLPGVWQVVGMHDRDHWIAPGDRVVGEEDQWLAIGRNLDGALHKAL